MSTKHSKAKAEFWEVVGSKITEPSGEFNRSKLISAVDYMLDKLPTWAVDKATGWMKDWQP